MMQKHSHTSKVEIINQLNHVEEQVRNLKNSLNQEKTCNEVLHQVCLAKAGMSSLALKLIRRRLNHYDGITKIDDLMHTIELMVVDRG
jgi:DNA-binding FrmR family transcriptional regulator